jgi:hypothetical protein
VPDGYDGPERRGIPRRAEDVVGWRLGSLENEVQSLERRVDQAVTRDELADRFRARDAILAREYIPRAEQQNKRDWNLRLWLGLISAGQLLIAYVALKGG